MISRGGEEPEFHSYWDMEYPDKVSLCMSNQLSQCWGRTLTGDSPYLIPDLKNKSSPKFKPT